MRPPNPSVVASLRAWHPAPLPRASLWLHGLGAATLAVQPGLWPQVLGVLACNHALLAGLMHPRGTLLGPNLVRLPEGQGDAVALTFDDGPDPEVTPRVLDLLDAASARASFFVIGARAARHPALLRQILARGHTVENHSQTHPGYFAALGLWALRREVAEAQDTIASITGTAPRWFRAPMGLRSPLLDPVLAGQGLHLAAWTRRGYDTRIRDPQRVLRRLANGMAGRDILLLHDGNTARDPWGRPVALSALPPLLARIRAGGFSAVSLAAAA
ncbi:polysaccharide deacetylase family protein [Falsiroseomonas sp. HC035]|uniref:polysaccharide deacetylase family protein n=1 Tax=Falsiroseomonas sp. HC035 TaxID=3390999 RepID=UPI003D319A95